MHLNKQAKDRREDSNDARNDKVHNKKTTRHMLTLLPLLISYRCITNMKKLLIILQKTLCGTAFGSNRYHTKARTTGLLHHCAPLIILVQSSITNKLIVVLIYIKYQTTRL